MWLRLVLGVFVNLEAGQTDPCKLGPNMELGFSLIVVIPQRYHLTNVMSKIKEFPSFCILNQIDYLQGLW